MFNTLLAVFIGGWCGQRHPLADQHEAKQPIKPCPRRNTVGKPDWRLYPHQTLSLFTRVTHIDPVWKLLVTTGFCGGQ